MLLITSEKECAPALPEQPSMSIGVFTQTVSSAVERSGISPLLTRWASRHEDLRSRKQSMFAEVISIRGIGPESGPLRDLSAVTSSDATCARVEHCSYSAFDDINHYARRL